MKEMVGFDHWLLDSLAIPGCGEMAAIQHDTSAHWTRSVSGLSPPDWQDGEQWLLVMSLSC